MDGVRLCQFKDAFGAPGTGVHKYRLGGVAVVDVALTFLLAWGLAKVTKVGYWKMLLGLFLLGFFLHWLFCVRTPVTIAIFGDQADPTQNAEIPGYQTEGFLPT